MFPGRRRNGDMPVGYLGCVTLRRQQCDMKAKRAITVEPETAFARP
jgi:hypothetical protein